MKILRTFDIDGVIWLEGGVVGLRPTSPDDVIITGRSYEETTETKKWLVDNKIHNRVFFNIVPFALKTRESSGLHKAQTLLRLYDEFYESIELIIHYEDDPVQIQVINDYIKDTNLVDTIKVVHVNTNGMVNLENERKSYE